MDAGELENLLIDRAAGSLPADQADAVAAALAGDPAARRSADEIDAVVRLARQAVAAPRPSPADLPALRRPASWGRRFRLLVELAAAAVIVIGLGVWYLNAMREPYRLEGPATVTDAAGHATKLASGAWITTSGKPAVLKIRGHSTLELAPQTCLRVNGQAESYLVLLDYGTVTCRTDPTAAQVRLATAAGTVSAKQAGSQFRVSVAKGDDMNRPMAVCVLAGAVMVWDWAGQPMQLANGDDVIVKTVTPDPHPTPTPGATQPDGTGKTPPKDYTDMGHAMDSPYGSIAIDLGLKRLGLSADQLKQADAAMRKYAADHKQALPLQAEYEAAGKAANAALKKRDAALRAVDSTKPLTGEEADALNAELKAAREKMEAIRIQRTQIYFKQALAAWKQIESLMITPEQKAGWQETADAMDSDPAAQARHLARGRLRSYLCETQLPLGLVSRVLPDLATLAARQRTEWDAMSRRNEKAYVDSGLTWAEWVKTDAGRKADSEPRQMVADQAKQFGAIVDPLLTDQQRQHIKTEAAAARSRSADILVRQYTTDFYRAKPDAEQEAKAKRMIDAAREAAADLGTSDRTAFINLGEKLKEDLSSLLTEEQKAKIRPAVRKP